VFQFREVMFFAPSSRALLRAPLGAAWLAGDGAETVTKTLWLWPHFGGRWPSNARRTLGPRAEVLFETIPALCVPLVNTLSSELRRHTVTIAHPCARRPTSDCG